MIFSKYTHFCLPNSHQYKFDAGYKEIEFRVLIEDLERFHNFKFLPFDLSRLFFNFEYRKHEENKCCKILKEINGFEFHNCPFRGAVYTDKNINIQIEIRNVKPKTGERRPMVVFSILEHDRFNQKLNNNDLRFHFLDKFLEPIFNLTDEELKNYQELHLINTKI